jgi:hypothetical protein
MTMASAWGNEVRFISVVEKFIGMWDYFSWVTQPSAATWFTSLLES